MKAEHDYRTASPHPFNLVYNPAVGTPTEPKSVGIRYRCPGGRVLQHYRRRFSMPRTGVGKDDMLRDRASKHDCDSCALKPRCCPKEPARKVLRSIYEGARDMARAIAKTDAQAIRSCEPLLITSVGTS